MGGEPQLFIFTAGLLLVHSLWLTIDKKTSFTFFKNPIFMSSILIICGILLSSIQVGITYMDYSYSNRNEGLPYNEVSRFALLPHMLITLFIPVHFDSNFMNAVDPVGGYFQGYKEVPWLLSIYPGFLISIMAVYGIIFSFSKKTILWLTLFIFCTILALGSLTPLHYYFYKLFPFFRYPAKFFFISAFCLLLIAAFGIERCIDFFKSRKIKIYLITGLVIIVIIADLFTAHKGLNPVIDASFYELHHSLIAPVYKDTGLFRVYSDPEIISAKEGNESIINYHYKWQLMQYPNLGILNGIYHVDGVPALELKYQHSMAELLVKTWPEKFKFLQLANVKYLVSNRPLELIPELKGKIIRENPLLLRVIDTMPRAWITGCLTRIKEGKIEELLDDSFDPRYSSLSDRDLLLSKKPYYREVDNIEYSGNGKIRIKCTTEGDGILVLSEAAYPGWKVYVNGKEKECLWLNLFYQGVALKKGTHEILFTYKPKIFNILLYIQIFFTILFICTFIIIFKKEKIKDKAHEIINNNTML